MVFNHVPQDQVVNHVIPVGDDVAEANDSVNLGHRDGIIGKFAPKPSESLADDFQFPLRDQLEIPA